jgi:NADPH-dependent glutamate synthase beta subunit-like oxidoreductase
VEIKTGTRVGVQVGLEELRRDYAAILLATGAQNSQKLNIPGESLKGIFPGVEFLREVNLGERTTIGKKVAVIGGGNVAIDAARSAIRLGAKTVEVYYRRSKMEMPAISEEVEEAIREGVKIHFLSSPIQMIGERGKLVGMECVKMELAELDQSGRRKPVPIKGSKFKVHVDTVISAIGQRVDRKVLMGLEVNPNGTVRVDPNTSQTSMKGVFAGGDVVNGPGWAIDAIPAGKKGAEAIYQYLS